MKKMKAEEMKFMEEFGVLHHMFRDNQQYFELKTYRDYGYNNSQKLIILTTDRYSSTNTQVYLYDKANKLQGWDISHVNIHAQSRFRIRLEIVLQEETDENANN